VRIDFLGRNPIFSILNFIETQEIDTKSQGYLGVDDRIILVQNICAASLFGRVIRPHLSYQLRNERKNRIKIIVWQNPLKKAFRTWMNCFVKSLACFLWAKTYDVVRWLSSKCCFRIICKNSWKNFLHVVFEENSWAIISFLSAL
jgi:hypothetical protein